VKSGARTHRAAVAPMVTARATAKADGDPGRNIGRLSSASSITGHSIGKTSTFQQDINLCAALAKDR
jgi:hypothetical protein